LHLLAQSQRGGENRQLATLVSGGDGEVADDVLVEGVPAESFYGEEVLIDDVVAVVHNGLDLLQLLDDELATLEDIDLDLPVFCRVHSRVILTVTDQGLQLHLHTLHHLLYHRRLVTLLD
jgi:hypothetical protein